MDLPIVCTGGPPQLFDAIRRNSPSPLLSQTWPWAAQQLELAGRGPDNHSPIHLGVEWHWHSPRQQ
jgi:hypothetical protein